MKYRGRNDVLEDLLAACETGPVTKTKLMYAAYLSARQFSDMVPHLKEINVVTVSAGDELITITEKGIQLLRALRYVSEILGIMGIGKKGVPTGRID